MIVSNRLVLLLLVVLSILSISCCSMIAIIPRIAAAEEIPYGGRLNVGSLQIMSSMAVTDEWQWGPLSFITWQLMYDKLWVLGPPPEYEVLPRLATSWESSEDAKTWKFNLLRNATFHDGIPVTAEDVAFSFRYVPTVPSFNFTDVDWEDIEVIDDYTVKITLKKGMGLHPAAYWFPILPKHIFEPYKDDITAFPNNEAIGSGPFKLKEFKPGEYLWLEANEEYYYGRPYLDEIVLKHYGNIETEMMALKAGEIDMSATEGIEWLKLKEFMGYPDIHIEVCDGVYLYWLTFNLHKDTPLKDLNVRRAIAYGIDVDRIIEMVFGGFCKKADSFDYSELPTHNPDLPQYDQNVSKANEILDNAGYLDTDDDGVRESLGGEDLAFEILVRSEKTEMISTAIMVKEDLAEIGISISVKTVDTDTWFEMAYAPQEDLYEIAVGREEPAYYGDGWIWSMVLNPEAGGAGWSTSYFNNATLDSLFYEMVAEPNETKRIEKLHEMQMIVAENLPHYIMYRPDVLSTYWTDKFEGFVPGAGGISTWFNPWTYFNLHLKPATPLEELEERVSALEGLSDKLTSATNMGMAAIAIATISVVLSITVPYYLRRKK